MAVGLAAFLALLPFHLVIKKLVPDPWGTYWKEILLGFLLVLWVLRCILARRVLITKTPVDLAVLFYVAVLLLRFILDRSGIVGAWGLYVSVMYLPLFLIVPAVLQYRPSRLKALLGLLVGLGALVALGGLVEFVVNVPLWPSEELVQRQGMPGMFIYGTNIRRVYFTFDSPTTLANTLAVLLPLALALFLVARRLWARLAAALAAALMAACIVVTFSRGIWVATVVSLVVMGILIVVSSGPGRGFVRRKRKPLLVVAGALVLLAVAWGLVWLAWYPWEDPAYEGVIELSPAAYEAEPVTQLGLELMSMESLLGEAMTQTWTVFDPIAGRDDTRLVLFQHPPELGREEIIYPVEVPPDGALRFAIALAPETWTPEKGDGVTFQVYVADAVAPENGQLVFGRYINPKFNPSDRRWRNYLLDLSPWAGRTVHLSLITSSGPAGDWSHDWAGWAELQVVRAEPDTFASIETESGVLRHTSSILDWAEDETNRDRLAAWSTGLSAWRAAPLWGQGLGSTGVAALRTHRESAFVTESQVLKSLVELGPLGLFALAFLWFQIGRVGYRAYRAGDDPDRQTLLLGILIGLLVIFIEGFVYQNLEVKQVNALFWTLVGTLAFLATRVSPSWDSAEPLPDSIEPPQE
jgi:hypothetical protein